MKLVKTRLYSAMAWRGIAAAFCLCVLALTGKAQSASKIIDQAIRAEGGKKALEKIRSTKWEGTATESGSGETGDFTLVTEAPDRFYREITIGAQQNTQSCNGKSCWGESGGSNIYTLLGNEESSAKAEAIFLNFGLLNLKKDKIRAQLLPAEVVNGQPADVLELTNSAGMRISLYFDKKSHWIVKETLAPSRAQDKSGPPAESGQASNAATTATPSSDDSEEITYSDFRTVQGMALPFAMEMKLGAKTFQISVNRVMLNAPVNESTFGFPALSGKPLPEIAQLLKDVDKNQKQIDKIKEDYACMEQEIEQDVDGTGRVKKQRANLYQVSYVSGNEIDRQIQKDGKPFSPDEQKKEDDRIAKRVARYQKEAAEKGTKKEKKDDSDVTIEDFLRISQFTNPRWERFRGEDVVVFDFGPNPNYKPKKLVEKAIHDLEGVVWIDANAKDVVRLEARFDNSLNVGGGMVASLQRGSAFVFEQTLVQNEVWLPSYDEVHMGVKLFMIKTFRADEIHHYYDYRKFHVSAKEKIGEPKPQ
ncbi:MAG TPA: hypothetical protein VGT03_07295 [Candidatus Acidoferrales bacterium]|nr:hypothetical protein [Candidatus Acidoferrales bacterium]